MKSKHKGIEETLQPGVEKIKKREKHGNQTPCWREERKILNRKKPQKNGKGGSQVLSGREPGESEGEYIRVLKRWRGA